MLPCCRVGVRKGSTSSKSVEDGPSVEPFGGLVCLQEAGRQDVAKAAKAAKAAEHRQAKRRTEKHCLHMVRYAFAALATHNHTRPRALQTSIA